MAIGSAHEWRGKGSHQASPGGQDGLPDAGCAEKEAAYNPSINCHEDTLRIGSNRELPDVSADHGTALLPFVEARAGGTRCHFIFGDVSEGGDPVCRGPGAERCIHPVQRASETFGEFS